MAAGSRVLATAEALGAGTAALVVAGGGVVDGIPGITGPVVVAGAGVGVVTMPLAAPFVGLAGFLPYSGLFGSQFLFFSASAASWPAVRCGTLLTKGTGTLVTYSATP